MEKNDLIIKYQLKIDQMERKIKDTYKTDIGRGTAYFFIKEWEDFIKDLEKMED